MGLASCSLNRVASRNLGICRDSREMVWVPVGGT